ncbi:MAG: MFS transporter [Eubacterium sp.]
MTKLTLGYKNNYSAQLFLSCWVAYFSTYICRLNLSVVMPELLKENIFSQSQLASVSSAFFICYGIGQLLSGRLGDKFSPGIMIFLGTFISALSNIFIFFLYKYHICLAILWGINGAVQSLVWSPMLRIAGDCFDKKDRVKFGTDISTTVTFGTLSGYGISLLTLVFLPWNYVFLTCGLSTMAASFFWIIKTKKLRLSGNEAVKESSKPKKTISAVQLVKLLASSGCLLLMLPIAIHGTLKDSVTQWTPTFFDSYFNLGTDISIIITMVLPIVNVSGAYIAREINKHFKNEFKTSVVFFCVAMVFLLIMLYLGIKNPVFALLCVAVITTCMHAINVMFITMIPLHFNKYGCVSTVGGLLNCVAYIGCGGLNMVSGKLLDTSSWNTLFVFWIILCVTGIILTVICSAINKRGNFNQAQSD